MTKPRQPTNTTCPARKLANSATAELHSINGKNKGGTGAPTGASDHPEPAHKAAEAMSTSALSIRAGRINSASRSSMRRTTDYLTNTPAAEGRTCADTGTSVERGCPKLVQLKFPFRFLLLLLETLSCSRPPGSGHRHALELVAVASTPSAVTSEIEPKHRVVGNARPGAFALRPGRSVLLPELLFKSVKEQCSRVGFPESDVAWTPSADDIKQMEARLGSLDAELALASRHTRSLNDYYRQYIGVALGNRRLIYINALHQRGVDSMWQRQAFNICDGGLAAWGAIYDVDAASFEDFRTNGVG